MTLSYREFRRHMYARGSVIFRIGPAGIEAVDLIRGYPEAPLSDGQVFVFIEGDELRCRKADMPRLARALQMTVRLWRLDGLERDVDIPWRVNGTDDIDEALAEAAEEIRGDAVTGSSKTRSEKRDIKVRFDGNNSLGCEAGKVRKLTRAIKRSFGRSTKLVVLSDEDFDAADTGKRLEEKAIEWGKFKKQMETFRQGKLDVKVLKDGVNKGKIGYLQRQIDAERNFSYYTYISVRLVPREDGGFLLRCRSGDLPALQAALRKTFAAKAAQVRVEAGS